MFTSSLFSKSTRYVAHARHLPNVIGNFVFLHSFQLAVVFYVLRSGSIIYLCGIPACTLPSTMINCGLGFHYLHYSTSSVALTLMAVIRYVLRIWAYGLSLHIHFLLQ
ncbi:uncharacterized protein LOC125386977 [Bombus terrestris]|uniref:Uncharacterized protein LOC125386977 n=1 Tax=Bombus terrestris TaxID=30195 RepID=A0A9C6W6P2_BOMTE|nr:uncharacterized protein LOC125386977 [Bombus terrestris]